MEISSLLQQAALNISKYPLEHSQGKLIPVGKCIPGVEGLAVIPTVLYRFEHVQVPLNWQIISHSFGVELNEQADKVLEYELMKAIKVIQWRIDEAIQKESDLVTMLPWLGKKYREGFGTYNSSTGGYGSITDCRTGNRFGIFAYTESGVKATFEIEFIFCLINI